MKLAKWQEEILKYIGADSSELETASMKYFKNQRNDNLSREKRMKELFDRMGWLYEEEEKSYDLYSEFDIKKHKATYIDYLEVIIDATGKIMYAVPSHQEKLIQITGLPKETIWNKIPMYADVMEELTEMTECIAVWNNFYIGKANTKQQAALRNLKLNGIYKGVINYG